MENEESSDGIEEVLIGEKVVPYVRIYISAGRENHDLLNVEEIMILLSSEFASPSEKVKEFIDRGMVNIFACSYDKVLKVL